MIELHGGPMDGWVVPPEAPALRPDWYLTLPVPPRQTFRGWLLRRPPVQQTARPGRYVLEADAQRARWREG